MASTVVDLVVKKVEDLLSREADLLLGVDDQVKSLRVKLLWLESFLKDVEERRRDNERIKVWVGLTRDLAYDAEDVIDQYNLRIELQQQRRSCFPPARWVKELPTRHVLGKKMKDINARFQEIVSSKSHFGIETIYTDATVASSSTAPPPTGHGDPGRLFQRRSGSSLNVDSRLWFENEARHAKSKLTADTRSSPSVVSIVGMGGAGKTTLAKKIYEEIKINFESHAWITVSKTFREKDLLQGIGEGFTLMKKKIMDEMSTEKLAKVIGENLHEKKYLLVVDDIWSRDAWNCIKRALPTGQGSRIMLTTRIKDIAEYEDPSKSCIIEMTSLDEHASWEFLCSIAFADARSRPTNLDSIGQRIASRCGGLPLAIAVVGGVLRKKEQSIHEWNKMLDRMDIEFREGKDQTQRILGLSYDDLPHHLKSCFLYLAIFPVGSQIDVSKLIRLWIAEGFIRQKEKLTMEEVAQDYIEDLIDRSMMKLESKKKIGIARFVRVHDLLLDLALSLAREMNFLTVDDRNAEFSLSSNSRRIAIRNEFEVYASLELSAPKTRSFVYTGPQIDKEESGFSENQLAKCGGILKNITASTPLLQSIFRKSKLLRVIDLEGIQLKGLPSEIGDMIQLHYLGVKGTGLNSLPSSIAKLVNLQTLDIRSTRIKSLPEKFWKIRTLRHVLLSGYYLGYKPTGMIFTLNDLQTLKGVRWDLWVGNALARMINLRHLQIDRVSRATTTVLAAALVGLVRLVSLELEGECLPVTVFTLSTHPHLQKLKLSGPLSPPLASIYNERSSFTPNLTSLLLKETQLDQDDINVLAKLATELLYLRLTGPKAYKDKRMILPLHSFPKLKMFVIRSYDGLEVLGASESLPSGDMRVEIGDGCRNVTYAMLGEFPPDSTVDLDRFLGYIRTYV